MSNLILRMTEQELRKLIEEATLKGLNLALKILHDREIDYTDEMIMAMCEEYSASVISKVMELNKAVAS